MFGMWEAVYSYLSRMVGNRTDAADAAGSLHAKISNVNNRLDYLRGKQPRITSANCAAAATTTVLDVAGAGYLIGIAVRAPSNDALKLKVTIDGTVRLDDITADRHFATSISSYSYGHNSLHFLHRFNTSLKVEVNNPSTTYPGLAWVSYVLD